MYTLSLAAVFLVILVPQCFGNIDELWKKIEALEVRDLEQSSRIDVLEQEAQISKTKLTHVTQLNEDLQNDLAAKTKTLAVQDRIIATLKKDSEIQKSEADGNRRKTETLELKIRARDARLEVTDKMFVQPEINLEDLNDIEALRDGTGENPDEDTHSALPVVDNTKTGSDDNETKSAPENFEFAKDGIHGIESDIPGKLLDKITRNQLVYRKLKNRNTESHISKRSMVNPVNPVAFQAVISRDVVEHLGINQNIVFDTVQENYGNDYHSQHGLFITPKSGLYLFSVSVLSYKGNVNPEFDAAIMKNGNSLAIAYGHADSGRYDQGSVTVVTHLNAGDEISVKNIDIVDVTIWGGKYTTFMGFLLTEM